MSIDKFGRSSLKPSKHGRGFKLTRTGDYNIRRRKLKNVGNPKDNADAVNKLYLVKYINEFTPSASKINAIEKKLTEIDQNKLAISASIIDEIRKKITEIYQTLAKLDTPSKINEMEKKLNKIEEKLPKLQQEIEYNCIAATNTRITDLAAFVTDMQVKNKLQ